MSINRNVLNMDPNIFGVKAPGFLNQVPTLQTLNFGVWGFRPDGIFRCEKESWLVIKLYADKPQPPLKAKCAGNFCTLHQP